MAWRVLVVEVHAADADALSGALLEQGAASVSVEDAAAGTPGERPVFDEPGAAPGAWTTARIRALLAADRDPATLLRAAVAAAGLSDTPHHAVETVPETDWVRASQAQFEPIQVSERLWIVPSWHSAPDPHAINIAIDPGLAFGSGSHPTTRACLRWLERTVRAGTSVLDYGCGSGILAIAACKLGAGAAVGVDVDPAAVRAARANAASNGVAARFFGGDTPLELIADLVVANILANPLKLLAPVLAAHCRANGRIVLAGILSPQGGDVAAAYAQWFDMAPFESEDGWVALEGVRRCE